MKLFSVNTIINGRFYAMYEPVPDKLVFPALRQYEVDKPPPPTPVQRRIQWELDEVNKKSPTVQAMIDEEAELMGETVVKAKIVPKGGYYNVPSEETEPDLESPGDSDSDEQPAAAARAKPKPAQKYVRRGFAFVSLSDAVKPKPGEKIYRRINNAFKRCGHVPPQT
jgi:hypothetical protein